MKGIVLDADVKSGTGVICAENGERFEFKYENCPNRTVLPMSEVLFNVSKGEAVDVYVVKTSWKARIDWATWFLFSMKGRVSRDQFFWFLLLYSVASPLILLPSVLLLPSDVFLILPLFLVFFVKICVVTKRFHDTNRSGGWIAAFLLFLAASLAIVGNNAVTTSLPLEFSYVLSGITGLLGVFGLYMCFAKGNMGKNSYGDEPDKSYACRLK